MATLTTQWFKIITGDPLSKPGRETLEIQTSDAIADGYAIERTHMTAGGFLIVTLVKRGKA
jgi:hypothetical protein